MQKEDRKKLNDCAKDHMSHNAETSTNDLFITVIGTLGQTAPPHTQPSHCSDLIFDPNSFTTASCTDVTQAHRQNLSPNN